MRRKKNEAGKNIDSAKHIGAGFPKTLKERSLHLREEEARSPLSVSAGEAGADGAEASAALRDAEYKLARAGDLVMQVRPFSFVRKRTFQNSK